MFQDPFSFEGRIRRTEYCLSYIILIVCFFFMFGAVKLFAGIISIVAIFLIFLYVAAMWFMLAQGAKRCHDRGNSGWFQLIPFYRLWLVFADSDYGPNKYGLNPKGQGNEEED